VPPTYPLSLLQPLAEGLASSQVRTQPLAEYVRGARSRPQPAQEVDADVLPLFADYVFDSPGPPRRGRQGRSELPVPAPIVIPHNYN